MASVTIAQAILESGWGKSELAQKANNLFGMKTILSGNTWSGSTWDGKSKYTKSTQEDNGNGKTYTIKADFRKYPSVEKSIADHSAYLLGAKDESKLRYDGLKGCTDHKKAIQIIKDGGYATDTTYVAQICDLIQEYKLTDYDVKGELEEKVEGVNYFAPLQSTKVKDITTFLHNRGLGAGQPNLSSIASANCQSSEVKEALFALAAKGLLIRPAGLNKWDGN